jgi:hypothetical protein
MLLVGGRLLRAQPDGHRGDPERRAAQPLIFGTVLPLCFLSGIFIPFSSRSATARRPG